MNISLRQLRAFAAVARTGSFTDAARALHLTQSAVSMLVRQLEKEFGMPLFDRTRPAITLTQTGRELLPLAQRMLDDLQQVVEGAGDLRALKRGTLRLAAPQLLACTWMPELIARFEKAYPDISLRLVDTTADDVVGCVRRNEVDIGVGPERPTGEDVEGSFLRQVPIRLVLPARHRLAGRQRVAWRDVREERWIVYSGEFHRQLEQALAEHDPSLSLRGAAQAGYLTTALALVGQGMGVTAAPDYARAFAAHFGVRFVGLSGPAINRAFFLYRRHRQALSPGAMEFVRMLG
jgi:DNA-binding transcriptional LysR family regulator